MTGKRTIILDVGLPAKKITGALEDLGMTPEDVDAVLITHEHGDHVKSVRAMSRKCTNALFCASRGTIECTENFRYVPEERLRVVSSGDAVILSDDSDNCKDITIKAFALSHDAAEPVGYSIESGGEKLAVVTDSGVITDEIYEAVSDADQLVFEANHDVDMLMFGEYPYPVKVRIKGDRGHLSNDYAGEVLTRILEYRSACGSSGSSGSRDRSVGQMAQGDRPLRIMLAHLSFHNNAPYYARNTIVPILKERGFEMDADYTLTIAAKDETTFF
jgi:phosphoribosyl 1,2-cyclic phosphodiesterase